MDVRSSSPTPPPPLVGRDRELALLHDRLTAARDGRGSLVLITGEAGIGKTALADALCREAAGTGAHVLIGHCYDRTETPPYGPWIQIARRPQALPDAANAPPVPRLDGATSQADLFAQARDFLVALTAQRPLVLVLEDLHWADSASLDLLRFVARGIDEVPLLLVATYRGEEVDRRHPLAALVPLLVREAPTERLGLRPLDTAAAQALVRARHDLAEPAVHRLAAYLIERTEGNALFLTELLRSLEEEGLIDRIARGAYAQAIAQTPVPALLRQIVDDRLSRLGDETAALLAIAAVVGQEVPLAVWGAVAGTDEEILLAAAERAEAAHLVTASARGDGIRFTHALIRDVLYEHVPALRRRRIHRQVAEALIALPAPDPDAVAYHLQQAGDERAAAWLVRAGERAEDAYALVTAAERYEAAIKLLDAQEGDPAERGWVRLLAAALRRHEDRDRAFEWAEEAVRLAATAGDPSLVARAQALLGLLLGYGGDYRTAVATIAAAADMVDRLPPGTGAARRREQQIDKVANRGTLIANLARGGRLAEARTQGEALPRKDDRSSVHARRTRRDRRCPQRTFHGLRVAGGAGTGTAVLRRVGRRLSRERPARARVDAQARGTDSRGAAVPGGRPGGAGAGCRGGGADGDVGGRARRPREPESAAVRPRPAAGARRAMARGARGSRATRYIGPSVPRGRAPLLPWDARPGAGGCRDGVAVRARAVAGSCRERARRAGGSNAGAVPASCGGARARRGRPRSARGWLDLHRRWLDFMEATLGRVEGEVLEAEWHRAAGEADRARDHAERALAHATTPRQPLALLAAHRILGILATDAGRTSDAEHHFAEALALADACRAPYERALTLLARADLAVAQGDRTTATELLDEVRAICTPMDARPRSRTMRSGSPPDSRWMARPVVHAWPSCGLDRARGRGAAAGGRRAEQWGDRGPALSQPPHGQGSRGEYLREARRTQPRRRDGVRAAAPHRMIPIPMRLRPSTGY